MTKMAAKPIYGKNHSKISFKIVSLIEKNELILPKVKN